MVSRNPVAEGVLVILFAVVLLRFSLMRMPVCLMFNKTSSYVRSDHRDLWGWHQGR
jgi:hypothetical protein